MNMIYNVRCLKQNDQSYKVPGKSIKNQDESFWDFYLPMKPHRIHPKKCIFSRCTMWYSHISYSCYSLVCHVWLFATLWTAALQVSLFFTISQSLLKLMSIESDVIQPSPPLSLLSSGLNLSQHQGFSKSQLFASGGESIRASASASVLPMNIQGWSPLGLTGLISMLSKGLSRVFSSTTVWKHQFFGIKTSLWSNSHIRTLLVEKP